MSSREFSKVLVSWWKNEYFKGKMPECVRICMFACLLPCLHVFSALIALMVKFLQTWVESLAYYKSEINERRVCWYEYLSGSVKLECAFIKHNYWYLLPLWIQSARLGFITSVPWKGTALWVCVYTHTHLCPLIHELTMHRHTPTNNRVYSHWGPHRLRLSLGEHRGSSNGNKNTPTHTHSPPSLVVMQCPVCNEGSPWAEPGGGWTVF